MDSGHPQHPARTVTADELIAQARTLLGVEWKHQGRTERAVDCIGLVVVAYRKAGIDVWQRMGIDEPLNYARTPSPELLKLVHSICTPIETPIPGCLLFFRFPEDRYPRHFGLYTRDGTVIHANAHHKRVVEHGYRASWPRWTHSMHRLPAVDYAGV